MNMSMGNMNSKFMDKFFRKVDGIVWDLMTGRVGVKSTDGITTLEGSGDDAQITVNMFDNFGMEVPAFAQSTPLASVNVGDLIYGDRKAIGWVVEIKAAPVSTDPAVVASHVKKFVIMTPDGTRKTWVPPKMSMLGFDSGVMVLRSLMNMLPGGSAGLGQMQNMMLPMMMMGGDSSGLDMNSIMPMMLFSQMGGATGAPADPAANPMAQMLPMMMMMQMIKGGKGSNSGSGGFFDNK